MLELALPVIQDAAGGAAEGSVSYRHDPMDAIEEALHDGDFHEIILSTLPHSVSSWLHLDLPHRVFASRAPGDDGRRAGTIPTAAEHQPAGA